MNLILAFPQVFLLEAELYSFEKKLGDAKSSYAAAITASCSAGYVHEQVSRFLKNSLYIAND